MVLNTFAKYSVALLHQRITYIIPSVVRRYKKVKEPESASVTVSCSIGDPCPAMLMAMLGLGGTIHQTSPIPLE